MFWTPKPEPVADQLSREVVQAAVRDRDRERRVADQHAALEAQDQAARDRLATAFGRDVADRIDLDRDYCIFEVRGVGIAFTRPAPDDRPRDRLLVGSASPVFHLAMRLQEIANVGIDPPRLLAGRRLGHDARDVDLRAVDPTDDELHALVAPPKRGSP